MDWNVLDLVKCICAVTEVLDTKETGRKGTEDGLIDGWTDTGCSLLPILKKTLCVSMASGGKPIKKQRCMRRQAIKIPEDDISSPHHQDWSEWGGGEIRSLLLAPPVQAWPIKQGWRPWRQHVTGWNLRLAKLELIWKILNTKCGW